MPKYDVWFTVTVAFDSVEMPTECPDYEDDPAGHFAWYEELDEKTLYKLEGYTDISVQDSGVDQVE